VLGKRASINDTIAFFHSGILLLYVLPDRSGVTRDLCRISGDMQKYFSADPSVVSGA
jgi:hypothetical protein